MAVFRGTRNELKTFLRQLPAMLEGRVPDPTGKIREIQLRMGVTLLSKIEQDFVTKARGGTGEDGIQWAPLKPETIANRRLGPADRKALTQKSRQSALTPAQQKLLNKEFRQRKARLQAQGVPAKQAASLARAQAYNVVRGQGGYIPTRKELLAGRNVEILRDTGELLNSFSPGVEITPSGADGQVFETPPGSVIVGTNKKIWHHYGVQSRNLPARPFWPRNGQLPSEWWREILDAALTGVKRLFG